MASHSVAQLMAVLECANFLDASAALSAAARQLNSRFLAGKSVEELRKTLGAANDMSEEEQAAALAEPASTPPPQEQVEADDVLEAALQEVDAKALCQLKAVNVVWRAHARRELCNRLYHRDGMPTDLAGITDLDVECLHEAGRPWEVVVAGRQLPQLARLHGWGFVVDVQAVREAGPGAEQEDDDDDEEDEDAPLGGVALRSCIQGEGDPPDELLLAAVACAAPGTVHGVPVQRLREDDAIGELDLQQSGIGDTAATLLGLMLPAAMSVRSLNLGYNQLCGVDRHGRGTYTTEGITKLCEGLKGSAVTSLNLRGNHLGPKGGAALAEGLKGNSTLQVLNLALNMLCGVDSLGNGTYTAEGITKLCEALKGSAVTSLNLRVNFIGDKGASALAAILKGTRISDLNLELNDLGPEGAAAIAEVLKGNSTLQSLNLEENWIGPEGAAAIAEGLKGNSTLQLLSLRGNNLGPKGGAALAEGLKGNSTLQVLNIAGNDIGAEGAAALAAILKETQIQELNLRTNRLGPEGGAALAEGLKGNSRLQSLDLRGNGLNDEAVQQALQDAAAGSSVQIEF